MSSENVEWTLSDFVDAIAAEVDRAQDTLVLKSHARGLSVSLKGLDLDVAVNVRMSPEGRVYFRTVEAGSPCCTVLKLDLEEVLQAQVEEVRMPAERQDGQPVETLPGITQAEIDAFAALSITTVEGLLLYARTPATLRELARKGRIAEPRLRRWLGFPYLSRIRPPKGAAGQETVIEGGNLGEKSAGDAVFFPGREAAVLSWSASRIVVKVPPGAVSGTVYARIDGALTNLLPWEAASSEVPPPPLKLTGLSPAAGTAGSSLSVTLQGTGFAEGITLSFGPSVRVDQVTLDEPGRITARLTLDEDAAAGARDVTAVLGDARDTLPGGFAVEASPPREDDLAVTGVTPNLGVAGLPLPVEILGQGFREGVSVTFGPKVQVAAIHGVSPTRIQALLLLPAAAVGRHGVTITNPDGKTATLAKALKVAAPPKSESGRKQE